MKQHIQTQNIYKLILSLAFGLCSATSWGAQVTYYREAIGFGSMATNTLGYTPHDNPTTYKGDSPLPTTTNPYFSKSSVTFSSTPAPSILVNTSAFNPHGEINAAAAGDLSYDIGISGPASTWIPVKFQGQYLFGAEVPGYWTTTSVSFGVGSASFDYSCGQGNTCTSSLSPSSAHSNITLNETLISYNAYAGTFDGSIEVLTDASGHATKMIHMYAYSHNFSNGGNSVFSSMAFIDPEFHIDSTWLALNPGATLSLPLGVGNAIAPAAIPVPTALWLFGSGLMGLMGLTGLTRKHKAV